MKNAAITPLDIHVVRNALRFAEFSDLDYCLGGYPHPPLPPVRRSAGPPVHHAAELVW